MKSQMKIRMRVMMLGLGAAMLLACSARAQQDMDPTYFDVNPGAPAASKQTIVRTAQSAPRVQESASAQSGAMLASSTEGTLEGELARMAVIDAVVALILLGGVASIVAYARAATRREAYAREPQARSGYVRVSAATAQ